VFEALLLNSVDDCLGEDHSCQKTDIKTPKLPNIPYMAYRRELFLKIKTAMNGKKRHHILAREGFCMLITV
jgi:hypothetical protein